MKHEINTVDNDINIINHLIFTVICNIDDNEIIANIDITIDNNKLIITVKKVSITTTI